MDHGQMEKAPKVGLMTGVIIGLVSLWVVFVFPFKYPRAWLAGFFLSMAWGAVWMALGGGADDLHDDHNPLLWAPIVGIAYFCYVRWVRKEPTTPPSTNEDMPVGTFVNGWVSGGPNEWQQQCQIIQAAEREAYKEARRHH